jgi:CheY-like chemotaxis protein
MIPEQLLRFLIIDDDPIHAMICQFHIQHISRGVRVQHFPNAVSAIDYIRYIGTTGLPDENEMNIVLLNLNMPVAGGWDFMEAYEKLEGGIRNRMLLYFTSASVDPNDVKRAISFDSVKDFLVKPITESILRQIINDAATVLHAVKR